MKKYYNLIKNITNIGFLLLIAFAIRTFYAAIPEEIYVPKGEQVSYEFGVPVTVVLKESSTEVFENFSEIAEDIEEPTYTVTCKLFGLFPIKDVEVSVVAKEYLYASGMPIGIYAKTQGVLIIGTGTVTNASGKDVKPAENLVKSGDYIVSINGEEVSRKEELIEKIRLYGSRKEVLGIRRNNEYIEVALQPEKNSAGEYMLGIWVRDDLAGVGTLTYCEENKTFGALGHAVSDGDTGTLMEMSQGWIYVTDIVGIRKGKGGEPGELSGVIHYSKEDCLGSITDNTAIGIHGVLDGNYEKVERTNLYEIGYKQEIRQGKAYLISSVTGESIQYEINIESLDFSGSEENKGILFSVTDKKLLETTGGIVQGMSGSPIIQNGKIVGAVTHVFVQDSTRGYGIFIENMLKN